MYVFDKNWFYLLTSFFEVVTISSSSLAITRPCYARKLNIIIIIYLNDSICVYYYLLLSSCTFKICIYICVWIYIKISFLHNNWDKVDLTHIHTSSYYLFLWIFKSKISISVCMCDLIVLSSEPVFYFVVVWCRKRPG